MKKALIICGGWEGHSPQVIANGIEWCSND